MLKAVGGEVVGASIKRRKQCKRCKRYKGVQRAQLGHAAQTVQAQAQTRFPPTVGS